MAEATVRTENSAPGALDVPTTDVADLLTVNRDGYFEREDHRPEPLYQYGTYDTSDTAGGAHQDIAAVSPVFAEARAQNLATAARALDPEDSTPAELVTLPQGSVTVTGSVRSPEEARDELAGHLRRMSEDPFVLGGPSDQQRAAGEEAEDTSNPDSTPKQPVSEPRDTTTATTAPSTASTANSEARERRTAQGRSRN